MGPQFGKIMQSGKLKDSGFLADQRAAFFLLEIDQADDLYTMLGPEIYGNCTVEASPVIPLQRGAEIFQQWAQEGR